MKLAPILLAITALLFWGLWAAFSKLATQTIDPIAVYLIVNVVGLVVGLAYALTTDAQLVPTSVEATQFALLAGATTAIGSIAYYTALDIGGNVSVITTVGSLYFVVSALIGIVFLSETLTTQETIGIILAVIATILFTQ